MVVVYTNIKFDDRVNDLIACFGDCNNKKFIFGVIENDYKYKLITKEERQYLRDYYKLERLSNAN